MIKHTQFALIVIVLFTLTSCKEEKDKTGMPQTKELVIDKTPDYNTDNLTSILTAVEYAHGGWDDLLKKRDVEYHYEYRVPSGEADISTERYIFATETSYGQYTRHDINALPNANGIITQLFDGNSTITMVGEEKIEETRTLEVAQFLRRANYFWFVMSYKLNDKGTIAKYLGQEDYKGTRYDKIEITYNSKITGKALNDIYILYVNPKTRMIDRFYFSLPFAGIAAPAIMAEYIYTEVEGQKTATDRIYFLPNGKGTYADTPDITQTLTRIKFNNGFTNKNILIVNK